VNLRRMTLVMGGFLISSLLSGVALAFVPGVPPISVIPPPPEMWANCWVCNYTSNILFSQAKCALGTIETGSRGPCTVVTEAGRYQFCSFEGARCSTPTNAPVPYSEIYKAGIEDAAR
jgi:hypothetical protein